MPIAGIHTVDILLLLSGGLLFIVFLTAGMLSGREGEQTAFRRLLVAAATFPAPFVLLGVLTFSAQELIGWILVGLFWASAAALLLPFRIAPAPRDGDPAHRFDERDTIFSRADLEPGTSGFRGYYERRPEYLQADDRFRKEPGLLSMGSREADRLAFAAVEAGFFTEEHLRFITDGAASAQRVRVDPTVLLEFPHSDEKCQPYQTSTR